MRGQHEDVRGSQVARHVGIGQAAEPPNPVTTPLLERAALRSVTDDPPDDRSPGQLNPLHELVDPLRDLEVADEDRHERPRRDRKRLSQRLASAMRRAPERVVVDPQREWRGTNAGELVDPAGECLADRDDGRGAAQRGDEGLSPLRTVIGPRVHVVAVHREHVGNARAAGDASCGDSRDGEVTVDQSGAAPGPPNAPRGGRNGPVRGKHAEVSRRRRVPRAEDGDPVRRLDPRSSSVSVPPRLEPVDRPRSPGSRSDHGQLDTCPRQRHRLVAVEDATHLVIRPRVVGDEPHHRRHWRVRHQGSLTHV